MTTPTPAARDLAWLWERHRTRWEAALAPARPDPDLLRLCADEAHGFAATLDDRKGLPTRPRDDAWEAVTLAAGVLEVYGRMVAQARLCQQAGFPTTLGRAFPALADACREALRVADRFVIELQPAGDLSVDPCLTDAEALAAWDAREVERERLEG